MVYLIPANIATEKESIRAWMDEHGLEDHVLLDEVPTFWGIQDDRRIAVVQIQPVQVMSTAIDNDVAGPTSHRIIQGLAMGAGLLDGGVMFMVGRESPGIPYLDKVLEPLSGYAFYTTPEKG